MLDIIICEDNAMQRKKLEGIIKDELINLKLGLNIVLSTESPMDVVKHLKNNLDKDFIYFLDVDLGNELNGVELAKEIRSYDSKGYIVFITSHAELALLPYKYKVQAFDFILKFDEMVLTSSISGCLSEAFKDYQNINSREKKSIPIDLGNRIQNFEFEEILFFETTCIDHKLRLHTIKGQFEFYGRMKDLEIKLPSYFYKSHRSYIVNTTKVKSFEKEKKIIYMVNGEQCYVSILYLKGLIKKCLI